MNNSLQKSIEEKQKQIEKLNKDIEELKKDLANQNFISIKTKDKEFRIYKWDKKLKDFKTPDGFGWSDFQDFVDLYDNNLIELEKYPISYYTKHWSKKMQNKDRLSWLCLDRVLDVYSGWDLLDYSNVDGRVVVSRSLK